MGKHTIRLQVLAFFMVSAAAAGALLRYHFVSPQAIFDYKNLLHAHSHVAMLGWVYGAFFVSLLHAYLPGDPFKKTGYRILFWLAQVTVAGMAITFSLQGYALFSIMLSTLHILLYYWFIVQFLSGVRRVKNHSFSLRFIYAGLGFLFLSTCGPWALAVISAKGLAGSDVYFQAIYFYLHFQYNGMFVFLLLGLWLWWLERREAMLHKGRLNTGFWLLCIANLPAYFLSLLGYELPAWLYMLAALSGVAQWVAILLLCYEGWKNRKSLNLQWNSWAAVLLAIAVSSLLLKYSLQMLSALPVLRSFVFTIREVVVAYLHLVMLGFVSCGLLAWMAGQGWLSFNTRTKTGLGLFLSGFICSEALIGSQGLSYGIGLSPIPNYFQLVLIFSLLMFLGLFIWWLSNPFKGLAKNHK